MNRRLANFYYTFILLFSEILVITSLYFEITEHKKAALEFAKTEAKSKFERDILYRKWVSEKGGIYVPVTAKTPPNPYLNVPHRDLTVNGVEYTLVNPAYMTRQVYEFADSITVAGAHITSLNPIRPDNKPDAWEANALFQFEKGIKEVVSIDKNKNNEVLRLMRPFYVENSCLKCHAQQGYNLGEVRGGISVSVNLEPYYKVAKTNIRKSWILHAAIFAIFLLVYSLYYFYNGKLLKKQSILQQMLEERNNMLQKQNEELFAAKQEAVKANKLKTAFLSNMSHEIRTPMNGIIGFTELLQQQDLTENIQKNYIQIIQKSGNRLLNTVNDIIEISKIESDNIKINLGDVEIIGLVQNLIMFFKPEIEKKGLNIYFENQTGKSELILNTDKTKIYSIISNLLKNAIKYTNEGFLKLCLLLKEEEFILSVEDSGIGIPKEKHNIIFDRFERDDIADIQAIDGSGLGLAIVKSYIEMLHGRIWLESEKGKGSVFYVSLPYNEIEN